MLPVVLAALLAFFVWLDTDFHHTRQQIESSFKQITGHNLVIRGGLSLEFWPATRFVSRQVEVTDGQDKVLFTAEKLAAEVAPLSIASGKLIGENLVLEKVQINVVREATEDDVEIQPRSETAVVDDRQSRFPAIPFKSIQVIDSALHIEDRINGNHYALDNFQLALELVSDDQMTIRSSLDFGYDNRLKGSMVASAQLGLGDQLNFEQVVARLDLNVDEKPLVIKASGDFSLDANGQLIQIRKASFVSEEVALQASFNARQSHEGLVLEAEINQLNPSNVMKLLFEPGSISNQEKALQSLSAHINLQKSASEMRIEIPSLELDNSLVQGSVVFSDNSQHFQFKIDELAIDPYLELLAPLLFQADQSAENKAGERIFAIQFNRLVSAYGALEGVSMKAHLDNGQLLSIQGNLNAKKLDVNHLLKAYEALIPENRVVSKLRQGSEMSLIDGWLKFSFDHQVLELSDIDLTIDDTLVTGSLEYSIQPPRLNAQMQLGTLDLDRYHYLLESGSDAGGSAEDNEVNPAALIQSLKRLQGSGSIKIEKLRYQQTDYQKIDIQFNDA